MFRTVAVVALICLTVSPAASAGPGQQYSVRNPSTGTGEGDVADAQHRVSELKAVVGQRQAAVVAAQQEVDRLAVAVTEARRELEAARAREQQAIAEETAQQAREAAAELTVRKHREELGRWASVSYRNGVSNEQMRNLQVLLGAADLDHYARTKLVLQQSGSGYAELIDQAQAAEQARHNAALKAAQAHEAALAAVEDAQGAALRADAAAAEQAVKTAELNALLQAAEQEMDEAEQEAARLRAQQWQARPDSKPGNGRPNVVTGPVGDCQGADTSPYGNGQAPLSALCPLWSAPGEHLRADAAYAFNMMSMEYATWRRNPAPRTTGGASPWTCAGGSTGSAPRSTCGCRTTPESSPSTTRPGRRPADPSPRRGTGSSPAEPAGSGCAGRPAPVPDGTPAGGAGAKVW